MDDSIDSRRGLGALNVSPSRKLRGFPAPRTSLIGRERELADIDDRIGNSRVVTLTGTGGSGKTRLGMEAGKRAAGRFRDGAVFVDLTALADPELVGSTIAQALGLPGVDMAGRHSRNSGEDEVIAFLARKELLMVLDNCEHLIEECARLTDRVLDECHRVKVLSTSREALTVHGESIFAVPPLELPDDEHSPTKSDAVRLLLERADEVRSGLDLIGQHESATVEICRRLDGIPLAIELAAAQLSHLSPEEIASRLDNRFRLLSGGRREQRHATLQAAVAWSYELLTEPEKLLLTQLGVFVGGFSLEAVEGVCTGENVDRDLLSDLVASLVRKSLVVATIDDRSSRYRLLETIRAFAIDRLKERGEWQELRRRHAEWYAEWTERLDRHIAVPAWRPLSDVIALDHEQDNLRTALAWAESDGRFELVGRIAVASDILWQATPGSPDEGLRWVRTALGADLRPRLRARCLILDTMLTLWRGDLLAAPEKSRLALEAVEEAGLMSEPEATGIFFLAGMVRPYVGDPAGRTLIAKGRELANLLGIESATHAADFYEAGMWLFEGNLDRACETYASFVHGVNVEDPTFFDVSGVGEAMVAAHLAGRVDLVSRVAQQLEALRGIQHEPWARMSLEIALAIAHLSRESYDAALDELMETFEWVSRLNMPLTANYVLTLVAAALSLQGDDEDASRILAAASAPGVSAIRTAGHFAMRRHYGHRIHVRLGDEATTRLRAEGGAMSLQEAAALARRVARGNRTDRTRRVVTFLFTDIVDSTPLVELLGDDAWDDLAEWHDRTLRSLFSEHGGEEVDHAGDGFFVAFPYVQGALDCARAIQRTMTEHRRTHGFGPNLRIGVHTTEATKRGGSYIGKGVHVAARVGAVSEGGQILASRATVDASTRPGSISEPRTQELKGLTDPLEVVTVQWQ
jgi:predicted ATPase/class 3 adenylate cyclase